MKKIVGPDGSSAIVPDSHAVAYVDVRWLMLTCIRAKIDSSMSRESRGQVLSYAGAAAALALSPEPQQ